MLKEFKEFAIKGNVVDMAVGIIVGAAFTSIVKSLVDDVLMPPLGALTGGLDFTNFFAVVSAGATPGPYETLAAAKEAGAAVVAWGLLVNNVVSFLLVALCVFFLVRWINRLKKKEVAAPPSTKDCPYCMSAIALAATRCAHCTSEVGAAA